MQIMRVNMTSGEVEEVYSNNGTEISGSSSVVVYKSVTLIGTSRTEAYYYDADN